MLLFRTARASETIYVHFVFPEESKGLCHVLTHVCPRPKPQMWDLSLETKNHWMEIDKSEITMKRVLGSGNFGEVWYGKC